MKGGGGFVKNKQKKKRSTILNSIENQMCLRVAHVGRLWSCGYEAKRLTQRRPFVISKTKRKTAIATWSLIMFGTKATIKRSAESIKNPIENGQKFRWNSHEMPTELFDSAIKVIVDHTLISSTGGWNWALADKQTIILMGPTMWRTKRFAHFWTEFL